MFIYKLRSCGFEFHKNHLSFRYHACCEQRVPWYSGNKRVQIHSKRICDEIKTHTHTYIHITQRLLSYYYDSEKQKKTMKKIPSYFNFWRRQRSSIGGVLAFTKKSRLDLELKDQGRVYLIFQVNKKYVTVLLDVINGKEAGILKFL